MSALDTAAPCNLVTVVCSHNNSADLSCPERGLAPCGHADSQGGRRVRRGAPGGAGPGSGDAARERGEEHLDSAEVADGPRGSREIGDRGEQKPCGWKHRGLVTLRMLYLIVVRLAGWMALVARSSRRKTLNFRARRGAGLRVVFQPLEVGAREAHAPNQLAS